MYLTSSRPDIMFVVCACVIFQVNLKSSHLHAVKRIFRYLKVQPKLGFWYPKDSPFDLVAYTDSDYAGASLDRKSTIGGCQFLGCRLISWQCKKQTVVVNSTTKAEYIAASNCYGQVKTVNEEMQISALVDKKKMIVTKTSVRSDLQLEDAEVFLNKQVKGMAKHKKIYVTPSHTKKVFANMKRQGKDFSGMDTPLFPTMIVQAQEQEGEEPMADETENVESVPIHSNDPLLSALEIDSLKRRVKKLEKKKGSRTHRLRRLFKVGSLHKLYPLKMKGRNDDNLMFDIGVLDEQEVKVEKVVSTVEVTTASATTTTVDEPKARGVVVQEPIEFRTTTSSSQTSQLPQAKDKGKEKMVEPEKPLKKKDQILIDEEIVQRLQEELKAELEEDERLAR
ncbi:hypothetical protein Tco_1159374 [Tanacetum coccineum]